MSFWGNGAQIYDEGLSLEKDRALETLTYMYDLIHTHGLTPADMVTGAHGIEPQDRFLEGQTVFLTGLPSIAQAAGDLDSPVRGKIGIAPPPRGPEGTESYTYLSSWHYGIPRGARAPKSAREFISFMTSPAVQKERALRGGPLPSIEKLYSDPEVVAFNPDYPDLLQMLRTARRRSDIPKYSQVSNALQTHLHRMLKDEIPPSRCMEVLRTELQNILEKQES